MVRVALMFVLAFAVAGCAAVRGASEASASAEQPGNDTGDMQADEQRSALDTATLLSDSDAVRAIRQLEEEPLGAAAPGLRDQLVAWMVASPGLHAFDVNTSSVDRVGVLAFPYHDELMLQYLLGCAAHHVETSGAAIDVVEERVGGIQSMIAAYRSVVRTEPRLRDAWLDSLDQVRRRGDLRDYVQRNSKGQ